MKQIFNLTTKIAIFLTIAVTASAQAGTKYELTLTNGSQMPISPAVIYVKNGAESAVSVGSAPTAGFVQLCQTGSLSNRVGELRADASVKAVTQTNAPIMPGESRVVEIEVMNPQQQSVHFETMYGKSKDACGVGSVNSHQLVALKQHVTSEVIQKDNALITGAFADAVLPAGMTYLDTGVCQTAANAISCLRELALPQSGNAKVRFFAGYFPSLITALETKYGAADVQTLLFPASGAIQIKVKLKH